MKKVKRVIVRANKPKDLIIKDSSFLETNLLYFMNAFAWKKNPEDIRVTLEIVIIKTSKYKMFLEIAKSSKNILWIGYKIAAMMKRIPAI